MYIRTKPSVTEIEVVQRHISDDIHKFIANRLATHAKGGTLMLDFDVEQRGDVLTLKARPLAKD